ncbi:MAG TPA: hypothetical protein VFU43_10100 [Streptosporangiaceae bacterium]|nr:hypothetical protein [Streptosporangiaceae bacterium]
MTAVATAVTGVVGTVMANYAADALFGRTGLSGAQPQTPTPTSTPTPSPTPTPAPVRPTATVTVTVGPPVTVVLPSNVAVTVDDGGSSAVPTWVTSIGGFMAGAGAIGAVVAEAAIRRRRRVEQGSGDDA